MLHAGNFTRIFPSGRRGARKGAVAADSPVGDVSSRLNTWERKSRSLSPVRKGGGPPRVGDTADVKEVNARMGIMAHATEAAREEAESALATVEGFAALNRKLVDELRAAVTARDHLSEDLTSERGFREQLELGMEELLETGLIAELKEKQEEFEASCGRLDKKEQAETARVAAVHARMEEEYSMALRSSERERARLEDVVASLEEKLEVEGHMKAVRAKEDNERATMGSEEVRSLRAGLLSRRRLRDNDRRQSQGLAGKAAGSRRGITGRKVKNLWLGDAQERVDVQEHEPQNMTAVRHPNRNTDQHGGRAPRRQPSSNPRQNNINGNIVWAGSPSSVGPAVHASAVASVESFLGDFVPKVRAKPVAVSALLSAAVAPEEKGSGDGRSGGDDGGATEKKVSKWAAIGRAGKMSARATAVCAEEAIKAAEAEASHRLRSLINSAARALSASWFWLLTMVPATVAAARGTSTHGGHGGDGGRGDGVTEGSGNNNHVGGEGGGKTSGEFSATVPAIVVRRLFQSCGILRSSAGGPTLAHADMELQRNAVGKGGRSVGHQEYFRAVVALSHFRFAGESKDEALEKLSRMLHQAQPASAGTALHTRVRQPSPNGTSNITSVHVSTNPVHSMAGTGPEDGLAGAERVLERDRRALEAIFVHYSTGGLVHSAALASFCKDFELIPGLMSRDDVHRIYVQLAYPNETSLTPKLLAAREGRQGRRAGREAGRDEEGEGEPKKWGGGGLGVDQWITWLGLAAIGCSWFDKQRA
ncbi:unnamed protein product, partial [Scytosiphon promiscuus]